MKLVNCIKTLVFNVVATISAWSATTYGIDVSDEHQMAIATTVMAVSNIVINSTLFSKDDKNYDAQNQDDDNDSENNQG
ncbi:MAG: hypothetical protein DGJ47_000834 [Rickettsiaceae bacterium]